MTQTLKIPECPVLDLEVWTLSHQRLLLEGFVCVLGLDI